MLVESYTLSKFPPCEIREILKETICFANIFQRFGTQTVALIILFHK
jgi:hypothetical protein